MTDRRIVLYAATAAALTYIAVCAVVLHAANRADYWRGWYDRARDPHPVWRLAWR